MPVGVSDFKEFFDSNYYYVDKSLFIKEVIDKGDKILLIPLQYSKNKRGQAKSSLKVVGG